MGKYIAYILLIAVTLFALEWFQIVDIPYFEIPDYTSGKKVMVNSENNYLNHSN